MRISRFLIVILSLTLLTGCNTQKEVAYWEDCSYKSAMDYNAQQEYQLKHELESIDEIISDILNEIGTDVKGGDDLNLPSETEKERSVNIENSDEIAQLIKDGILNRIKTDMYYDCEDNSATYKSPQGLGQGVVVIKDNKSYIHLRRFAGGNTTSSQLKNYLFIIYNDVYYNLEVLAEGSTRTVTRSEKELYDIIQNSVELCCEEF